MDSGKITLKIIETVEKKQKYCLSERIPKTVLEQFLIRNANEGITFYLKAEEFEGRGLQTKILKC